MFAGFIGWLKFGLLVCVASLASLQNEAEISFRNNVQPVLSKAGCNAGACHGAAAGQNGFRLSLRGYDDDGDFLALTRQALGRRVNPADPGRSLLLLKATGAVPHKGGKRFELESREYEILSKWIAEGIPGPNADERKIARIEVSPKEARLTNGASQQLKVEAHFSDGVVEDVTRWAKYTSANESVVQVDELGNVKVSGFGEGAITAWYLSRIDIGTITVPYTNEVSDEIFAKADRRNFIDEQVLEKLQSLKIPPSGRSTDAEFLRRVYLDTTGVLPTPEEAREFIANPSASKRDELIEKVLTREEFVDYWTYRWSELLLVSSKKLRPTAMWSYYKWVRDNVAANTPWDVMVRSLLTAQGSTLQNGAGNFFILHEDPRMLSETTSQAFLGMSINCAKCHNHPMEKWTNDQYYQMANLFSRVRFKSGANEGENVVFVSNSGDLVQPLRGKPQKPAPLDGKSLELDNPDDRREHLAEWLTAPENPYFARAIVNRVWANYFGVGLVENVDDLRATNPSSNEKLLSATAKYLVDQKYDLRNLMRTILQSETYQRTSEALSGNKEEKRFYSRYYPRRLMAEVLLDAYSQVTGAPTEFKGYPTGWRAVQLPDSSVESYFLSSFGRAIREQTCTCERTADPSVSQVLHMFNGDSINKKLSAKGNQIEKVAGSKMPVDKLVEEGYLAALGRFPTPEEKSKIIGQLTVAEGAEYRAAVEDFYWALMSSKEFLFNH